MLSSTSLFGSSVSRIFLFESCSARRARFEAIWPQSAYVLPRCGVPRKMISFVRLRIASDRRMACSKKSVESSTLLCRLPSLTSLRMMPPRLCTTNASGFCATVRRWFPATSELINIYSIIDFALKPDRQISAVLRDAVLVVGLEKTVDHVGVVSVRPYARLGKIDCEILFRPEDGRRRAAGRILRMCRVCCNRPAFLSSKQRPQRLGLLGHVAAVVTRARRGRCLPGSSRMASEAVNEHDTVSRQ